MASSGHNPRIGPASQNNAGNIACPVASNLFAGLTSPQIQSLLVGLCGNSLPMPVPDHAWPRDLIAGFVASAS